MIETADPDLRWLDNDFWRANSDFTVATSSLDCPKCSRYHLTLLAERTTNTSVAPCSNCHGIWIDVDQLHEIIKAVTRSANQSANRLDEEVIMQMLRSIKDIQGYVLGAQDGEIGRVSDVLFDDKDWAVRYVVADTHKWLPGRKVLISPISIGEADGTTRSLNVGLTKDQITESPPLDADAPVSRQYEIAFNKYYDWAHYWAGPSVWGSHPYPRLLNRAEEDRCVPESTGSDPNLRSAKEVEGYHIEATDTDIGHIADFILALDSWIIRYLVINTSNWLPASRKVLVAPDWVDRLDWQRSMVLMDLTGSQIVDSPEFDPSLPVNRGYEVTLYDFYGRP